MSNYNCSLPPGFEGINGEPVTKNLGVPDETNAEVGIIDEEDPYEDFFNSANISYDPQMEMTQQQTASALPENPAVNNALNNAAQPETLMTHSVTQMTGMTTSNSGVSSITAEPELPMAHSVTHQILGSSIANASSNAAQWETPVTHSVPQQTGATTSNSSVSNTTAEPVPPMTHSFTQQIRVTTGESKVAQEIIILPLPRNHNPQQVIPVVCVADLVSSSTRPPAAASSAGSSNEGQVKNSRKRRLYEQSTESTDKAEEARIKKAKYSHDYRTMKNLKLKELEKKLKELQEKCSRLEEKLSLKNQEEEAARQELSIKDQELEAARQEISSFTQVFDEWNQFLREWGQQQLHIEYNQENNG